ncbi:MAG: ATP-dependent DNA helicase RecG [Oceanospirillaceae bacterium]|nr:ATP-dependent DNA helicase RecG [Oceanospirillaceae bacterium]
MSSSINIPCVSVLKGVGAAMQIKLERLGIENLQDLLFHLPIRYQDRTSLRNIGTLRIGDEALVEVSVSLTEIKFGKKKTLLCRVSDGTGSLTLRFFHFSASQKNTLSKGKKLRCFGEVRPGPNGLEMVHPEYKALDEEIDTPVEQSLTPVYPMTEGLQQNRVRSLMAQALLWLESGELPELLPEHLRKRWQLPELHRSLVFLHAPSPQADRELMLNGMHPAQRRLAFEELLAHHLTLLHLRKKIQAQGGFRFNQPAQLSQQFLQNLAFTLTGAQQRVSAEIAADLAKPQPMLRLVQGDVGSGKTVVAALAALQAVENNYQAAIMAPTEILAEQHYSCFKAWFEPLNIKVGMLTGKIKGKKREQQLKDYANGDVQVIVGTHALFQEEVRFYNLGLAVIDEQHRFGVHQRLSLREKGRDGERSPHQLIMTATPIPRTLTMSAYADLDCSVIDELPPGRTPVKTVVIPDDKRDKVIDRVKLACEQKRQVYWVCTLIEESEALQCQAAEVTAEQLKQQLPELKIGLIHGRMKSAEKVAIMAKFKGTSDQPAELDLLVATTVIEVGVDVPNASVMIIENPERLGLAQLHQLRGRVGRGSIESFCLLMYRAPLSYSGKQRLQIMRDSNDGFVIAEKDLEIRGPGEVLGTRQTGEMQFKIADLQRDADLLERVQELAQQVSQDSVLSEAVTRRWLGAGEQYGHV